MRHAAITVWVVSIILSISAGPGSAQSVEGMKHEALNATVWTQTSVEYAGVAKGLYALAHIRLDEALLDPGWTASLEQLMDGRYENKPAAVILDADETVLDNSPYQARLIKDGASFSRDNWNAWVQESVAGAVPGAVEFTRYAASNGVAVIYLTNRSAEMEDATRSNLKALGFPVSDDPDGVLTRGEIKAWNTSSKTLRRRHVADTYRIVLLVGDNFGDFSDDASGDVEERTRAAANYSSWWGKRWIVLPNVQYGSWESALYKGPKRLSAEQRLERKFNSLQTKR